jgi:ABC-2 type transport system ATP-binding protein
VVIIAQGAIQYDGSLDGIIDQFSGHKMITLQLAEGASVEELSGYGQVMEATSPKVKLKIPRQQVPRVLSEVLSRFPVEDVAVEDPPLEEVIAEVFSQVNRPEATDEEIAAVATKA